MSTLTRTWTVTLNQTPASEATVLAQMQNILYQMKTNMVAAGGVVQSSSDGSANAGAADHWLSAANVIRGSGGANRSWVVIQHTASGAGSIYVLIAYSTASDHLINLTVSSSAFSGGGLTSDPTTTGGNAIAVANQQVVASTLASVRFHTLRNTTGDFMFLISPVGSGRFTFLLSGHQLAGVEASDPHVWLSLHEYRTTSKGVFTLDGAGVNNYGLWQHTGAIAATNRSILNPELVSGTKVIDTLTASGSPVSGAFPALPAVVAFSNRIKGTLVDIALAPNDVTVLVGTEEPASPAASTTMIVGAALWVPNGGVTPVL